MFLEVLCKYHELHPLPVILTSPTLDDDGRYGGSPAEGAWAGRGWKENRVSTLVQGAKHHFNKVPRQLNSTCQVSLGHPTTAF